MAIPSSKKEGKEFEKCPEGSHICRCVTVVDLGLQETKWGDKEQVYLGFEVTDFDVEWTDKNNVAHKGLGLIGVTWTNNLYEEANLGMNLISWRGRPFTPEEEAAWDIEEAADIAARKLYREQEKYKDDRKAELAPLDGDGMDAMRKAISALSAGEQVPQEFTDYMAKVAAIKQKYTKG